MALPGQPFGEEDDQPGFSASNEAAASGEVSHDPVEELHLDAGTGLAVEPEENAHKHGEDEHEETCMQRSIQTMQKYSMPLIFGVSLALVWANVDYHSYHLVTHSVLYPGLELFGHGISLHFLVNDIFMCFFFGLAISEVTEAFLPGGPLSPISRAVNPLAATMGGIIGPGGAYMLCILALYYMGMFDGQMCETVGVARRLGGGGAEQPKGPEVPCDLPVLLNGWGVPTATDISLAWMFAILIFGCGHPAISYLLLLAIADDAMGLVIIAVWYSDPTNPVEPLYLILVVAGAVIALVLRLMKVMHWVPYLVLAFPVSWLGLLKAHVHPALALAVVVPFLPDKLPANSGKGRKSTVAVIASAMHNMTQTPRRAEHRERRACTSRGNMLRALREQAIEQEHARAARAARAARLSPHVADSSPKRIMSRGAVLSEVHDTLAHKDLKHSKVSSRQHISLSYANWMDHNNLDEAANNDDPNRHDHDDLEHVHGHLHASPLHAFAHTFKLPVDIGMFFFGLANAGVKMGSVGGITIGTLFGLSVGKTFGIAAGSLIASCCGYPRPPGLDLGDLYAMSAVGGVGLTVALFVSEEAYVDPELRGQAKLASVLSVLCAGLAWIIKFLWPAAK